MGCSHPLINSVSTNWWEIQLHILKRCAVLTINGDQIVETNYSVFHL